VSGAAGRGAYLAYRAGADIARAVPPALGKPIARTVSRAFTALWPRKRRQVETNLVRASRGALSGPALRRATARVFENYGRYWHEMFRLRSDIAAGKSMEEEFESEGYEHIAAGARAGHGVILALPHLGNWDAAGAWLSGRGYDITVVAEPVEPPELFEWFAAERRALGMEVVALGPDATSAVLRAVVCLVCDRDLSGDGVAVELFGATTTMPGGPALLAMRTGAPLLPVGTYFRDGGHLVRILPPVPVQRQGSLRDDVRRVTQDLADRFEALIAAVPEQWLMMQPVWPDETSRA
jgi:phosphatidylinositol dimannoside acyltransferase